MICVQCEFLLRRYGHRVSQFLKDPPQEYMKALGYDKDVRKFSLDCEVWLRQMKACCKDTVKSR